MERETRAFLDALAELIAEKVVFRLSQGQPGMIDQKQSPLGRRRHCYAVRRRLSEGSPGAAVVGRRHLLSPEALAEELARLGKRQPSPGETLANELRRELGLLPKR